VREVESEGKAIRAASSDGMRTPSKKLRGHYVRSKSSRQGVLDYMLDSCCKIPISLITGQNVKSPDNSSYPVLRVKSAK
jgi:hypothetical protein